MRAGYMWRREGWKTVPSAGPLIAVVWCSAGCFMLGVVDCSGGHIGGGIQDWICMMRSSTDENLRIRAPVCLYGLQFQKYQEQNQT